MFSQFLFTFWSAALSSLTCLFLLVELIQAFFHLLYCRSCFRLIRFKLGRGEGGGGMDSSDSNLFSRLETEEDICCSFFVHFYYLCENPIDFWPTVCRHSPKPSNITLNEESSSEQLSLIETSLTFYSPENAIYRLTNLNRLTRLCCFSFFFFFFYYLHKHYYIYNNKILLQVHKIHFLLYINNGWHKECLGTITTIK